MRTTPKISADLGEIEDAITRDLIPALTGITPDAETRTIFALPARHGGMNQSKPSRDLRNRVC